MNQDTEKALLRGLAMWVASPGPTTLPFDEARAYLATLEPKPEPKRGVEEILREVKEEMLMHAAHIAQCDWAAKRLIEALRLYREERERVKEAAEALDSFRGTLPHTDAYTELRLRQIAEELERRDDD